MAACEFGLPEEIIHHIQSYLDGRDAVRTSVLSKSWYAACSTRPVLCLVEKDFTTRQAINTFESQQQLIDNPKLKARCIHVFTNANFFDHVLKTVEKYVRLNLKIDKFVLTMEDRGEYNASYTPIFTQLIEGLLKLGVNEIDLNTSTPYFYLPALLFTATSLTKLSLNFMTIGHVHGSILLCSRLVSLSLCHCVVTESRLRVILSACPLIEYLNLEDCYRTEKFTPCYTKIPLDANKLFPALDSSVVTSYYNLRVLRLDGVMYIDGNAEFFRNFSRIFPCVEDVVLKRLYVHGLEEDIQISSHSIKYLTLDFHLDPMLTDVPENIVWEVPNIHLDVPNILNFSFNFHILERINVPSLSVTTTMMGRREWMSHLNLQLHTDFDLKPNWLFPKLRQILKELSCSAVTVYFRYSYPSSSSSHHQQEFPYFLTAVVENVIVHIYISVDMSPEQFGDLCRFFRPNFITQDLINIRQHPVKSPYYKNLLCSKLMAALYGVDGLEEVTLEFFKDTILEWQPVLLRELTDGPNVPYKQKSARLRLRWRQKLTGKRKERTDFADNFLCLDAFKWFSNPW